MTIIYKAWNSPVQYPSWESAGSGGTSRELHIDLAEPELLSYRKSERVVQNKKDGHKIPNTSHNYHDEI